MKQTLKFISLTTLVFFPLLLVFSASNAQTDSGTKGEPSAASAIVLKPGQKECKTYDFRDIGSGAGTSTYRVTESQVPASLNYTTEKVVGGTISGISITACIEAQKAKTNPGAYDVIVKYGFFGAGAGLSNPPPYATKEIRMKVEVLGP